MSNCLACGKDTTKDTCAAHEDTWCCDCYEESCVRDYYVEEKEQ